MVKNLLTSILLICVSVTSYLYGEEGNFVVTEKQPTEQAVQQTATVEDNTPYFVLFTSNGCAPCIMMKNTEVPKLQKAGYAVTIVNISQDDQWNRRYNITTVPRLFLLDRKTRQTLKGPWVGFTRAESLLKSIVNKTPIKTTFKKVDLKSWINANYNKNTQLSWGVSGQSVYDHLCDGSGGTHVFKMHEVKDLELWEALALHDAVHTGKFKP